MNKEDTDFLIRLCESNIKREELKAGRYEEGRAPDSVIERNSRVIERLHEVRSMLVAYELKEFGGPPARSDFLPPL